MIGTIHVGDCVAVGIAKRKCCKIWPILNASDVAFL